VYVKKVLLAVAVAMVVLAGAGVAYAAGSGEDSSEPQATGAGIEKAKSIALDYTNGGRVTGTERDITRSRSSAATAARSMFT
jgi:hypothetical protein